MNAALFPSILPTIGGTSASVFPHVPLSNGTYHLVGTYGEFGLYEFRNVRMGGKSLKVLHVPTGWLKSAPDRTTASLMCSRYAGELRGIAPDYSGKDGWGNTARFNWKRVR